MLKYNRDKFYIGKTNRSFKIRISEHLREFINKKPKYSSNGVEHLTTNKHTTNNNNENHHEILEI